MSVYTSGLSFNAPNKVVALEEILTTEDKS